MYSLSAVQRSRTKEGAFSPTNLFRGCKWSPDGSCILTANQDNVLRLYDLPPVFVDPSSEASTPPVMVPSLCVSTSDLIYDMTWFPLMSSASAESSVFLVSCGRNPIHLIDAYSGRTRATYKAFNHLDQLDSAHSIAFSRDGEKIYAGFNGLLRVFYTSLPGSSFFEMSIESDVCVQKGILSCIAFNPMDSNMFAVGSYSKDISLNRESDQVAIHVLKGQKGGVTHIQFSEDGRRLLSGGRKDTDILCWDLRNLGTILCVYKRSVHTNQTFSFDMKEDTLFSGNDNGFISVWDLKQGKEEGTQVVETPSQSFKGHEDCVNGISVHPSLPIVVSCSGSRKFPELTSDDEDERFFSTIKAASLVNDNCLKLWQFQEKEVSREGS